MYRRCVLLARLNLILIGAYVTQGTPEYKCNLKQYYLLRSVCIFCLSYSVIFTTFLEKNVITSMMFFYPLK